MGYWEYPAIAAQYQVPMTVTGFEPIDLLQGVLMTVRQLEAGTSGVQNGYTRIVSFEGNEPGAGHDRQSLPTLRSQLARYRPDPLKAAGGCARLCRFDAECRFNVEQIQTRESEACVAGQILQGLKKPANARPLAGCVPPETRSAPPWSHPKAPARPTTVTPGVDAC